LELLTWVSLGDLASASPFCTNAISGYFVQSMTSSLGFLPSAHVSVMAVVLVAHRGLVCCVCHYVSVGRPRDSGTRVRFHTTMAVRPSSLGVEFKIVRLSVQWCTTGCDARGLRLAAVRVAPVHGRAAVPVLAQPRLAIRRACTRGDALAPVSWTAARGCKTCSPSITRTRRGRSSDCPRGA
jgi:hypothetical protein